MKKVLKIEEIDEFPLYDITVEDDHCFALSNGTIAHNSLYPKDIVSGGTGGILSSNIIWIIGKAKEKNGTELSGYKFTINTEKSRIVREGVKFPFTVTYAEGVSKWSGMLEFAVASGHVIRTGNRYQRAHVIDDKKHWAKDTSTDDFWNDVIQNTDFNDVLENTLVLGKTKLMAFDVNDPELLLEDDD